MKVSMFVSKYILHLQHNLTFTSNVRTYRKQNHLVMLTDADVSHGSPRSPTDCLLLLEKTGIQYGCVVA